jgi:hypothetical protein
VLPPTSSNGIGTMTGTYDDVSKTLSFTVTFSGLSGTPFNGYIDEGNGTFIQSFNTNTSPYTTTLSSFTNAQSAVILAGNSFIAIETNPMSSPEIRGQIIIGMEIFNNAAQNAFYGIGGYSFTKEIFTPDGVQPTPYVVSGPSPQNDFSYTVTANGGAISHSAGVITTTTTNTNIYIEMKGNNVRKFACKVYAYVTAVTNPSNNIINVIALTNLGNQFLQTGNNAGQFVGFNVTGNENEYITAVFVQFPNTPSPAARIALYSIMVGDNSPQNVALNFDGVDDYVSIPSNTGNNTGSFVSFTVTCWIKPDANQSTTSSPNPDENDIISKWAGLGSGTNNKYPFVVRYLNTTRAIASERGKILVGIWDGANFPTIISTTAVNDGKWHHVAFVKTNITNTLTLYIDGLPNGSITNTIASSTTNNTPLQIGRRGNGQNYFRGDIDEVRIWSVNKSQADIQAEMFCKNPNTTGLQAAYNFSNGVPHDNNPLIMQVQDASTLLSHGTLNSFAKTSDISNFVTGQVKYVRATSGGNGSSWSNAFAEPQQALPANTCNDLFDVYVAKGTYTPAAANVNFSFEIPSGMRIYGGFAGTEKSINQRNLALIHSTNKTTLSGDLNGNDTAFNFTINRGENSNYPVRITGSNVVFDGFKVSGSSAFGAGILSNGTNATIKNSRVIDNTNFGLNIFGGGNATIANCSIMGNNSLGINIGNSTASIKESLIANNGFRGIYIFVDNGTRQTTITNSTIASNADFGIDVVTLSGTSTNTLKNTLIYGNAVGGINSDNSGGGTISNTITYSLVQGDAGGTNGNLNGNTVNPQFVSPLANSVRSDAGDYRLKWCSLAINAGNNAGISPLDLDRKPRNFNTTADMGAYEFLGNMPSQVATSNITGTIDSPTYAGGAIQTITSTAKILAPAGAIDFIAPNSIILSPGFEARGMSKYFKAEIGGNQTCVN